MYQPLFELLKKDTPLNWSPQYERVFKQLKIAFTFAPILHHFEPELETILETDALDYIVFGVLSQKHPHPETAKLILYPIAFMSEKMSSAESNYCIGDKELLAIISSLEKWHIYLHQLHQPFMIFTNYYNLQMFATKSLLSRPQVRWVLELAQYDFKIVFRPGKFNGKADALTRRSRDLPEEGDGRSCPTQALIPIEKFSLSATSTKNEEDIRAARKEDRLASEIIEALKTGQKTHKLVPLGECQQKDNLTYVNGLLYVPNDLALQLNVLKSCDHYLAAGHPGRVATYELVTHNYWWPKMRHTIARYIRNCETCMQIKPARHAPYGLLKPLEVPIRQWSSVSLDLITGLPPSNGHDALLVVVDFLSKMSHYIPTSTDVNSKGIARLYFNHIFRLHGIPDSVVSDRGTQFILEFTRALCALTGMKQNLSTSFHPQTDG